jgi:hypothetical protein
MRGHICPFLLTYSWSWALLEKPPILQLLKKFPVFYGIQRFITVFSRALHWSLSWARSIQSIPSYFSKIHFNHLPLLDFWKSQNWKKDLIYHTSIQKKNIKIIFQDIYSSTLNILGDQWKLLILVLIKTCGWKKSPAGAKVRWALGLFLTLWKKEKIFSWDRTPNSWSLSLFTILTELSLGDFFTTSLFETRLNILLVPLLILYFSILLHCGIILDRKCTVCNATITLYKIH